MKSRLIYMLLTALGLAVALLIAVQVTQSIRRVNEADHDDTIAQETDISRTLNPVVLQTVSELDGQLLLAGHAEPDAIISIINRDQPARQIKSNENGDWETTLTVQNMVPMIVDFIVIGSEGSKVHSDQTLYRIPPPEVDTASSSPQALLMAAAAGGPTRIFQSPFRGLPVSGPLSVGAIDYDQSGGVIFHGQSERDGRVRVYANETAIGETHVQPGGEWYMMAANTLPNGRYDVRAELISDDGNVLAEVKVPFERLSSTDPVPANSVKVFYKPYSWQVLRGLYGGGQQFTAIYAPENSGPILTDD